MIGRPAVWGLAVNGQGGVAQVLHLLEEELARTMRLAGCARLEDITPDLLTQDIGVPAPVAVVDAAIVMTQRASTPSLH